MIDFAIRRLRSGDSLEDLTGLLHRAFHDLALLGMACQCADQTVARTRERVGRGDCFIAVMGGEVIGTLTLEHWDRGAAIPAYRDPANASVHQLAVDPTRQGEGVGRALIDHADAWARARGYERLALDTPRGARHQLAWYLDRGFDVEHTLRVPGRPYASVVLVRPVAHGIPRGLGQRTSWPATRPRMTSYYSPSTESNNYGIEQDVP